MGAGRALRRRRWIWRSCAGARAGGRAGRGRAHGERSGRDDPLPAGGLAGAARAAGDAGRRGAPGAPAAGGDARSRRPPTAKRGAWSGARTRATTVTRTHAYACVTGSGWRCGRCTRRPRRTCCGPRSCCARRPSCWTALVADTLEGRQSVAVARLEELETALARLVVVSLAEAGRGHLRAPGGRSRGGDPRAG